MSAQRDAFEFAGRFADCAQFSMAAGIIFCAHRIQRAHQGLASLSLYDQGAKGYWRFRFQRTRCEANERLHALAVERLLIASGDDASHEEI
jgi:hypothetical protein